MKNLLNIFLFISIIIAPSYAQNMALPANIQSPNAASLGKYGDFPVSYYTGTPGINIPIYTLSERGMSFPISLNYDASGILVDNPIGWVGQNWSLDAGGVITRTVRGKCPDELNLGSTCFPTSLGDGTGSCGADKMGYMYQLDPSMLDMKSVANNVSNFDFDFEPDLFTFNFLGISGKFFLGNDGIWKVISDANIKVEFNQDDLQVPYMYADSYPRPSGYVTYPMNYPKTFSGFKLILGDGTTYYFGYNANAVEYSVNISSTMFNGYNLWKANAWYLTKVEDKYHNTLFRLEYERGQLTAHYYKAIYYSTARYSGRSFLDVSCDGRYSFSGNNEPPIGCEIIAPVYLKFIKTNSRSISFNREKILSPIYEYDLVKYILERCIRDDNNRGLLAPLGMFGFGYDVNEVFKKFQSEKLVSISGMEKVTYFISDFNESNKRLFLKELNIYDGQANYMRPELKKEMIYKFAYEKEFLLPKLLLKRTDHWGYFQEVDKNTTSLTCASYDKHHETDTVSLKYGILNKITYPTGGTTKFYYEANTYSKIVNDQRTAFNIVSGIAGGLRIKKIINSDGIKDVSKEYYYVNDYQLNSANNISSGTLSARPVYFWPSFEIKSSSGGTYSEEIFSANSIIPLSTSFGSHIGYSEVVEKLDDGSFTRYKFTSYGYKGYFDGKKYNSFNISESPYDSYTDYGILRGKLLSQEIYDAGGNLIKKNVKTYRDISSLLEDKNYYTWGTNVTVNSVCSGTAESVYKGNCYRIYNFKYDVIKEESTDYMNGMPILNISTLNKKDYITNASIFRLTQNTTQKTSTGDIVTQYFYPIDYPESTIIKLLVDDFRVDEVVASSTTQNGKAIGAKKVEYKLMQNHTVPAKFLSSSTDLNSLQVDVVYNVYDKQGNLLQYTDRDKTERCILWGFYNSKPIAEITNASYTFTENKVVYYDGFEQSGVILNTPQVAKSGIRAVWGSVVVPLNSLKYGQYKLSYWKSFDGLIWDHIEQIIDVSANTTSLNIGQSSQFIDELRIYPKDAQMKTYNYSWCGDLITETDVNGNTIYYEYDQFGRLKCVRDNDGNILNKSDYHYKDPVVE